MHLLAIDPGTSTGVAVFLGYRLAFAGVYHPDQYDQLPGLVDASCARVVVEQPQFYTHGPADPQRLAELAKKVGRLQQLFPMAELVFPRQWKGQVPKPICHARGVAKLDPGERLVLDACSKHVPKGQRHDMLDAVCLGLWAMKRT